MRSPESTPSDPDELIRFGRIASVDLAAARCTAILDDEGAEGEAVTGPIRWIESRAGATRTWSPPSVGEEVILLCAGGQIGNAVALRGLSNTDHPPAGTTLTELVAFADGAVLSYDAGSHALAFDLPGGTLTINAPGGVEITGPVEITGAVEITGDITLTGKLTASDDVIASGKSLKNHTHGGVQGGSSQTSPPT